MDKANNRGCQGSHKRLRKFPSAIKSFARRRHREILELVTLTHIPFTYVAELIHSVFHSVGTVKESDAKIIVQHQARRQHFSMPMMCLTDEQVMHLVQQLSAIAKKRVLRNLIAERDTWMKDDGPDERQMRLFAGARGLDWDGLSETAREHVIDDLLHEP